MVFGMETVLRITATKTGGEWYRKVLQAAERSMDRWHGAEAERSRRRGAYTIKHDGWHRREDGGGDRGDTAVDKSKREMANRAGRFQFEQYGGDDSGKDIVIEESTRT